MSENNNWFEQFRSQSRENIYVLKVRAFEEDNEIRNKTEIIDCPKGEAGVLYANNLLCRFANEILMDTDLEGIPWEIYRRKMYDTEKNFKYIKRKGNKDYAVAELIWLDKLLSDEDIYSILN